MWGVGPSQFSCSCVELWRIQSLIVTEKKGHLSDCHNFCSLIALAGIVSCTREFDQHSPSGTAWVRSGGARNLGEGQGAWGEGRGKVPPGNWMRMRTS